MVILAVFVVVFVITDIIASINEYTIDAVCKALGFDSGAFMFGNKSKCYTQYECSYDDAVDKLCYPK